MNKDMINIDDFVREKLGDQPERENPAAWLKMKALLDKEMPERVVPFYFRWGKPMAFLGAALLLAGLCVGGYELTKGIRGKGNGALVNNPTESGVTNSNHHSGLSNSTTPINIDNTQQTAANHPDLPVANVNSDNRIDTKKQSADTKISDNEHIISSGAAPSQLPVKHDLAKADRHINNVSGSGKIKTETDKSNKERSVDHTKINKDENNVASGLVSRTSDNDKLAANKLPAAKSILSKDNNGINADQSDNSDIAGQNNDVKSGNEQLSKKGSAKSPKQKAALAKSDDHNWAGGNQTAKAPVLQKTAVKDSLPFTSIVQKETISRKFPRKATTSVDTQSIGKIALPAVELPVAAKANEEKPAPTIQKKGTDSKSNEFAAVNKNKTSAQKDSANAAGNSELAVKSKKAKRTSLWEKLNLPEAAADAKRDLGNAKFFAGFSGGFNYSLSNTNNFQGVQFGPTGELVFNKHWSLFGAIRYFNRSGGTKTVNDNYAKESANNTPDSTSGANWYFKVHTDSTSRYFNFSTLHSFEMPITLRYAFNKFYVLTGLNLAYYLSVNVEEVEKKYSPVNAHLVQTNSTKPILNETKPLLSTSDFGSKFGLGYVIGAGYQIAPAWQADIRLVNTFWDNAKGDGANKLSKDFYKLPSVQISVGYQFNRGRAKPTFGPTTTAP